jgi:hypothetical protein
MCLVEYGQLEFYQRPHGPEIALAIRKKAQKTPSKSQSTHNQVDLQVGASGGPNLRGIWGFPRRCAENSAPIRSQFAPVDLEKLAGKVCLADWSNSGLVVRL